MAAKIASLDAAGVWLDTDDMEILITSTQRRLPVPRKKLLRLVEFVARRERRKLDYVEIVVVGRQKMARLNEELLGHAGPTDVISYDLGPGPSGGLTAQIIVCADVAIRQGRLRSQPAWKELLLYITHGLLHTLGYDDLTMSDAGRMHAREDELLTAFGVGAVYSGRAG